MKYYFFFLFFPAIFFAQKENEKFNRAIEKGKFHTIERTIKREVRKIKHGTEYDNGPGSGMQINHGSKVDTLIYWLKKHSNVEDAAWDKCAIKISIYPNWIVLGAKLKTDKGIKEMCFYIQQGTLAKLHFLGFRSKNILKYKKMYECPNFIEIQKKYCNEQL